MSLWPPYSEALSTSSQQANTAMRMKEYALRNSLLNVAVVLFRCWYVWNRVTPPYGSAHSGYRVSK